MNFYLSSTQCSCGVYSQTPLLEPLTLNTNSNIHTFLATATLLFIFVIVVIKTSYPWEAEDWTLVCQHLPAISFQLFPAVYLHSVWWWNWTKVRSLSGLCWRPHKTVLCCKSPSIFFLYNYKSAVSGLFSMIKGLIRKWNKLKTWQNNNLQPVFFFPKLWINCFQPGLNSLGQECVCVY